MKRAGCLIGLLLFLGAGAGLFYLYASMLHPEWLSARLWPGTGAGLLRPLWIRARAS